MNRLPSWIVVAVCASSLCVLASCFSDPDIYTAHTEVTPEGQVIQTPRVVSVAQLRSEAAAPGPRLLVESAVHDFGRLDPLTTHQHAFVIRNVGDAPLELSEGPTTCKCTLARLTQRRLVPGDKTTAVIEWNTGRDRVYAHGATIYSNDPRQKVVQLKIKGEVRVLLQCEPAELTFSRIEPDQATSATTVIYSQVWDQLHVHQVAPARDGVKWTVEEATPAEKQSLHASAAWRLTLTLPQNLEEGYFAIPVQLQAGPAADLDDRATDTELMLQGKVLRRLCVYGSEVDVAGTIDMGRIPQGKGASLKLLLKLRDPQRDLTVRKIETIPSSLQVRVEPHEVDEQEDAGLYDLLIELPKDAPTFRLPPKERGLIRIEFDHPRVSVLELPVALVVAPREAEEY